MAKVSKGGRFPSLLLGLVVLWAFFVATGFSILAREEFTPVARSLQPVLFPPASAIPLASDRPTLLLFAHPQCPCTRATLHELDALLTETGQKVSVFVIFSIPDGLPAGLDKGDLWNSASAMPGLHVIRDDGGQEALRFGVTGSGHTLLYAPTGKLLFSGGITGSRGHEGDNVGREAVTDFILNGHASVSQTPVFGCSLW